MDDSMLYKVRVICIYHHFQQYFSILWTSVLLLEETVVTNLTSDLPPVTDKLSHKTIVLSLLIKHGLESNSLLLVVIDTDCIDRWM